MRLWPLMTLIGDVEGVSVTQMRSRVKREFGMEYPRREVRVALDRLVAAGVLDKHARGGKQGGRVLYWRKNRCVN